MSLPRIPFQNLKILFLAFLSKLHFTFLQVQSLLTLIEELFKFAIFVLKNDRKDIIFAYDLSCSPPTYGDLLYVLYFCNFLSRFSRVKLFILVDNLREDWEPLILINGQTSFVSNLLHSAVCFARNNYSIEKSSWDSFSTLLHENIFYIPFSRQVIQRKSIYHLSFNFLFLAYFFIPDKSFFLSKNNLLVLPPPLKSQQYISVNLRLNPLWSVDQNLTEDMILSLYSQLRSNWSGNIVFVSSLESQEFTKSILLRFSDSALYFSKSFEDSFFFDLSVVLSSKAHIQPTASGLAIPLVFSNVPYLISSYSTSEFRMSSQKFAPWSSEKQFFLKPSSNKIFYDRLKILLSS